MSWFFKASAPPSMEEQLARAQASEKRKRFSYVNANVAGSLSSLPRGVDTSVTPPATQAATIGAPAPPAGPPKRSLASRITSSFKGSRAKAAPPKPEAHDDEDETIVDPLPESPATTAAEPGRSRKRGTGLVTRITSSFKRSGAHAKAAQQKPVLAAKKPKWAARAAASAASPASPAATTSLPRGLSLKLADDDADNADADVGADARRKSSVRSSTDDFGFSPEDAVFAGLRHSSATLPPAFEDTASDEGDVDTGYHEVDDLADVVEEFGFEQELKVRTPRVSPKLPRKQSQQLDLGHDDGEAHDYEATLARHHGKKNKAAMPRSESTASDTSGSRRSSSILKMSSAGVAHLQRQAAATLSQTLLAPMVESDEVSDAHKIKLDDLIDELEEAEDPLSRIDCLDQLTDLAKLVPPCARELIEMNGCVILLEVLKVALEHDADGEPGSVTEPGTAVMALKLLTLLAAHEKGAAEIAMLGGAMLCNGMLRPPAFASDSNRVVVGLLGAMARHAHVAPQLLYGDVLEPVFRVLPGEHANVGAAGVLLAALFAAADEWRDIRAHVPPLLALLKHADDDVVAGAADAVAALMTYHPVPAGPALLAANLPAYAVPALRMEGFASLVPLLKMMQAVLAPSGRLDLVHAPLKGAFLAAGVVGVLSHMMEDDDPNVVGPVLEICASFKAEIAGDGERRQRLETLTTHRKPNIAAAAKSLMTP